MTAAPEPRLTSHLVLGRWAARVESDSPLPLDFLQDAFKQRAVTSWDAALGHPEARLRFESCSSADPAFSQTVAEDAFELSESPAEIRMATPILRARATRWNGSIDAAILLQTDAAPRPLLYAHLSVTIRRLLLWANLFYLHAGAVVWRESANLFIGEKGAGKSTACLHLARAGAQLISEDHVLIRKTRSGFVVSGSECVGRVTERTEEHLFSAPLPVAPEDFAGSLKKEFALSDHFVCARAVEYPYRQILFPRVADRFAMGRISEMDAALRLLSNARQFFRFSQLRDCEAFLEFFLGMVAGCDCYDLSLSPRLNDLDELISITQNGC